MTKAEQGRENAAADYHVTLRSNVVPKFTFRFRGGPIDDLEPSHRLFAAIGRAAVSWARLESHLDALLIHVNAWEHSREIYNPEHPVSFDGKVKLLKRWFNQHPALIELAEPIRELTSRAKALSRERNLYLHSILEDWDAATREAKFHGLKWVGNDNFDEQTIRPGIDDLESFAHVVNVGNRWLEEISRTIFTLETLERLQRREPRIRRLVHRFRRWRARLGF